MHSCRLYLIHESGAGRLKVVRRGREGWRQHVAICGFVPSSHWLSPWLDFSLFFLLMFFFCLLIITPSDLHIFFHISSLLFRLWFWPLTPKAPHLYSHSTLVSSYFCHRPPSLQFTHPPRLPLRSNHSQLLQLIFYAFSSYAERLTNSATTRKLWQLFPAMLCIRPPIFLPPLLFLQHFHLPPYP